MELPPPSILSPFTLTEFIFMADANPFNDWLWSQIPPILYTACVLSNTPREPSQASLTQSRILKTGLTPFPIGHAMLSSPYLTAWRQTGAEEAAEETLILNLSPCHYRPVWPPIRGPWVMWETLGPVLPTPVGQAACSVQTKLKTTGQAQLGLTSMRRRALYAHSVVRRREAWILISLSLSSLLACFLPLSPSHHASRISGLSDSLRLNQMKAEAVHFDSCSCSWRKYPLKHWRSGWEVKRNEWSGLSPVPSDG